MQMKQNAKTNVYIEHGYPEYTLLFITLGYTVVNDVDRAHLVCFTGGADVSPSLYGDDKHHTTFHDEWRDAKEERLFKHCLANNIPMVGICRGGQFLNVMSGGRMYQDVTKHTRPHAIQDVDTGEIIWVSSTHHQMMMPSEGAIIVATSNMGGKREWFDKKVPRNDVSEEDYEVVFYPETKSLCFQPHPEFNDEVYTKMKEYFNSCINRFLLEK